MKKNEENEQQEDFIYDPVRGGMGKKSMLSVLNKKTLSRYELEEVMNDWE